MTKIPRIVIAGTHSGAGKTSLTLGLVALLRRRGLQVQTFKVGPDYLDPTYLALASGRPCYNLDGWMTGRDYVEGLFRRAASGCDIAVVEGVMGLYDGADASSDDGSTAQVARWLNAPVLLVVNAHGMARSIAAMAQGYARFDPEVRVAGVVANQCGSESHVRILREALQSGDAPPLVGAVAHGGLPALSSRHLGLVSAGPQLLSPATLKQFADAMESFLDMDEILRIAAVGGDALLPAGSRPPGRATLRSTSFEPAVCVSLRRSRGERPALRLGVARDDAFHFYYPDNLDALEQAGCECVPFSPLADRELPEDLDGLYLGGGYPEEYAAALAANENMREQIRRFPRTVYAECGGLMYLSEGIQTTDGARHPQVGLLPTWARMGARRRALGYVEVTFAKDTCWGGPGQSVRGHEYHYSELERTPEWETAYAVRRRGDGKCLPEGFQRGNVLASYVHLHFASRPAAIENFIRHLEGA